MRLLCKKVFFIGRLGAYCKQIQTVRNLSVNPQPNIVKISEDLSDKSLVDPVITKEIIGKVNDQLKRGEEGRLFAVVHLCGKQFKITAEDIIIIEGHWPPYNGDQIQFEKVMLVGARDFTLIGRPILPQGLVNIKATVIEKDLSHTKPIFYKRRRKQYMRMNFYRSQLTMLRINEISILGKINEHNEVENYERIML